MPRCPIVGLLAGLMLAGGCARPPAAEHLITVPLPAQVASWRSPNGQAQAWLIRAGDRWHGVLDEAWARRSSALTGAAGQGPPVLQRLDGGGEIDLADWRPVNLVPPLSLDAWGAADPAAPAGPPAGLVALLRVEEETDAAHAANLALARHLAVAADLPAPAEPAGIAEAAARVLAAAALGDEETGEPTPAGRRGVLQWPVWLDARALVVEQVTFAAIGPTEIMAESTFVLLDLATGAAFEGEALLPGELATALRPHVLAAARRAVGADEDEALAAHGFHPGDWPDAAEAYPTRSGLAVYFPPGAIAPAPRGEVRLVVPWRDVAPLLPADSPWRRRAGPAAASD